MVYNVTKRVSDAFEYFDRMLEKRIDEISELSGVSKENFVKLNPAEFIEKNKFQTIEGYDYKNIKKWIIEKKKDDKTFLISPLDAVRETANQCSYKSGNDVYRKIRASKCEVFPCPKELALDFFIRNHRQTAPLIRDTSICFCLEYKNEVIAVMLYDIANGAVRGKNKNYELVRLSISKGTQIYGGASKLQNECEKTLKEIGVSKIFSYSNATINSGSVYQKLGFEMKKIDEGQPFVILKNNKLVRLINLYPESTDEKLSKHGWLKTHLGGNKMWEKRI